MSKKSKITIILVSTFILLVVFVYFALGIFAVNFALNTNLDLLPKEVDQSQEPILQTEWLYEQSNYDDVYITSNDGYKLHALEIENPTPSSKWLIAMHGYRGEVIEISDYGYNFYLQGYNILLTEQRSTGESEGTYTTMGIKEQYDLLNWIDYIITKDKNSKIVLFGVSMGASSVMLATGHELPSNVLVAIADCGYTSVIDEFTYVLDYFANLPKFPIVTSANAVCKLTLGFSLYDGNIIESVKKSTTPTLFIHGDADDFVPFYMLDELYSAHSGDKEKLIIEGAEHARSSSINPELYWQTVWEFVGNYI